MPLAKCEMFDETRIRRDNLKKVHNSLMSVRETAKKLWRLWIVRLRCPVCDSKQISTLRLEWQLASAGECMKLA
jgi:hypothetical protein